MKTAINTIVTLLILFVASANSVSVFAQETQQSTSTNNLWIEVGTVYGKSYAQYVYAYGEYCKPVYLNGNRELKLSVMHIGEKLIYRVERNGKYYPVHFNDGSYGNACAEIDDFIYADYKREDGSTFKVFGKSNVYFDVPSW